MTTKSNSQPRQQPNPGHEHSLLYRVLVSQPVERWYLRDLDQHSLTAQQRRVVNRQAVIGWLQSLLLVIVFVQSMFAGLLPALPPELRTSLSFLHRIEWGAYLGIVLVAAQVAAGWTSRIVLTNRFFALAWRIGRPRLVTGKAARYVQMAYLVLIVLMVGAVIWVRLHGFIFQPAS
jgi:hypothetical protein